MRKMKELIAALEFEVNKILVEKEFFVHNPANAARIESALTKTQVKALIEHYKHSQLELNEKNCQPLCDFLAKRWHERLIKTNAIENFNPRSHGNQIYGKLANLLAPLVHKHPHQLLMPTLAITQYENKIPLNRLVMSEDNKTYIDVLKCLEQAEENHTNKLYHTHPVNNQPTLLSDEERHRVINYHAKASRYYADIQANSLRRQRKAHNNFRKNLGYLNSVQGYGEAGDERLISVVFKDLGTLVDIFAKCPPSSWPELVLEVPCKLLNEVVMKGQSISTVLEDNTLYTQDRLHNSAVFFLIYTWYDKQLSERKNSHNSFLGWATGFAYDKEIKQKGVVLVALKYLTTQNQENFQAVLMKNENTQYKGALLSGVCGLITNKMIKVLHPSFIKEEKKGWLASLPSFSFR